jgi:hypothetical protein
MTKELYAIYDEHYDISFIMEETTENGEPISTECVGWYHGEPSDEDNQHFKGKLKATYNF